MFNLPKLLEKMKTDEKIFFKDIFIFNIHDDNTFFFSPGKACFIPTFHTWHKMNNVFRHMLQSLYSTAPNL